MIVTGRDLVKQGEDTVVYVHITGDSRGNITPHINEAGMHGTGMDDT
jgi:hypothetical protein